MKNRGAWAMALLLALLLVAGVGVGTWHTYGATILYVKQNWGFGVSGSVKVDVAGPVANVHTAVLGPVVLVWWRRMDQPTYQED